MTDLLPPPPPPPPRTHARPQIQFDAVSEKKAMEVIKKYKNAPPSTTQEEGGEAAQQPQHTAAS